MTLTRSPVAGRDGVCQFYKAFFTWTRLFSSQPSHTRLRPRHVFSYCSSRRYSATQPRSEKMPFRSSRPLPLSDAPNVARRTIFITERDLVAATQNDMAVLKDVTRESKTTFELDQPRPDQKHRRLWLIGADSATVDRAVHRMLFALKRLSAEDPSTKPYTKGSFSPPAPQVLIRTHLLRDFEAARLDVLTDSELQLIKTQTRVSSLTINLDDEGRPLVRIIGNRKPSEEAWNRVKAVLRSAISAANLDSFKLSMRHVPWPVAIISTVLPTDSLPTDSLPPSPHRPGDNDLTSVDYRGMTVSSFTPVSLDPVPIISFNIRTPSRTLGALRANGYLHLHIPAANSLGRAVAHAFTEPREDPTQVFRDLVAKRLVTLSHGRRHLPELSGPGISQRFRCILLPDKTVDIGDHVVLFAKVDKITTVTPAADAARDPTSGHPLPKDTGLVYLNRSYGRVGELADEGLDALLAQWEDRPPLRNPEPVEQPATKSTDDSDGEAQGLDDAYTRYFEDAESGRDSVDDHRIGKAVALPLDEQNDEPNTSTKVSEASPRGVSSPASGKNDAQNESIREKNELEK